MEIERLVCHPRLPFVAGLRADRPAVRVLDGALRELAVIGGDARPYVDEDRDLRTPTVTWHPYDPVLMVPTAEGVVRWSPSGVATVVAGAYLELGFSPDGRTLLAMRPPSFEEESYRSDVIDLAPGSVVTAMAARADGSIVVASGAELHVVAQPSPGAAEVVAVREFLAAAPELPAGIAGDDLEDVLELIDEADGDPLWWPSGADAAD
ncbi:hypothetical protein ACQP00_11130 [Dactylosporangium sp. CS-047395]|uniref:hypothetical protein n=1 Tax=Dactylosporangium sp. CS-047395 TaxID=3239936 RepID=UPI003D900D12